MGYILVQYKHHDDDDSVGKFHLGNLKHRCTDGCLGYSAGIKHCCWCKQVILLVYELLLKYNLQPENKAKVFISLNNQKVLVQLADYMNALCII